MSTKRQPKGIPVGGQFAANEHDEASSSLAAPSPVMEKLDAAMEGYGITADDVPGLREAWAERFAPIYDEGVISPRDVILSRSSIPSLYADREHDISYDKIGNHHVVTVHVPEYDEDGDYIDSNDYRHIVEEPEIIALLDKVDPEKNALARERSGELSRINDGKRTPWSVMGDSEELRELDGQYAQLDRARRNLESMRRKHEDFTSALSSLEKDAADPDDRLDTPGYFLRANDRPGYILAPGVSAGSFSREGGSVRYGYAVETERRYRKAVEKSERLTKALEEAHSLPEGPLRDFLIAERPERTYPMNEGTGRNKRTVTKKYRPTSDLVSDQKSAASSLDSASSQHNELVSNLNEWRASHDERVSTAEQEVSSFGDVEAKRLRVGWTGAGEPPQRIITDTDSSPW